MKGLVIYDSSHGNTRQVAEAISDSMKDSGIGVDTFYVKKTGKLKAEEYDFLVVGSPTKWGTMSFTTKRFLGKVKSKEWANKPFAAFDTENPENIERKEGSAAEKIAEQLQEKHMRLLQPVLKSVVIGWKGPMQEGEIERAKEYAKELVTQLKR